MHVLPDLNILLLYFYNHNHNHSKFLESKKEIIPSFRSGIREASLAELSLQ